MTVESTPTYPALSIQQPFAWLIVNGYKDIENRDWSHGYRGSLLIHTGKLPVPFAFTSRYPSMLDESYQRAPYPTMMPKQKSDYLFGGIVGVVTLVGVTKESKSPWFRGPYGFEVVDAQPLPFMDWPGGPGIFSVRASAVHEHLASFGVDTEVLQRNPWPKKFDQYPSCIHCGGNQWCKREGRWVCLCFTWSPTEREKARQKLQSLRDGERPTLLIE